MVSTAERVRELAREALAYFESKERQGEWVVVLKDSAPEWVQDLVFAAHNGMFPDDWRYSRVMYALDYMASASPDADLDDLDLDFADSSGVDTYTRDRIKWLGSHVNRPDYVDRAVEELGWPGDTVQAIGYGQFREAQEIYRLVLIFLRKKAEGE